jgi:hypothetical protein
MIYLTVVNNMQKEGIDPRIVDKVNQLERILKSNSDFPMVAIDGICRFALSMMSLTDQYFYQHDIDPNSAVTMVNVGEISKGVLFAVLVDDSELFTDALLAEKLNCVIKEVVGGSEEATFGTKLLVV